jgi:hypothetical protein
MRAENALLRVKAVGRDDCLKDVTDYGLAIIEAAVAHACARILCDESELEYALGTLDTYASAKFIAEYAPKVARVAIVCGPQQVADADFWEAVAVNRGLCVRFFLDLGKAETWLDEEPARSGQGPPPAAVAPDATRQQDVWDEVEGMLRRVIVNADRDIDEMRGR